MIVPGRNFVMPSKMTTTKKTKMMNKATTLLKSTFSHWYDHNAFRMGAALSYYALFSIAPLLILLAALVGTIFNRTVVNTTIAHGLRVAIGNNLAGSIQSIINTTYYTHTGFITTVVSGAILIIAALSVFSELNSDLEELWNVPTEHPETETTVQTIITFIKERLLSLLLILFCGFLLLLTVAFMVLISFFHHTVPLFLQTPILLQLTNIFITLLFGTVLFTLIYRILPNTTLPWKEILRGAFITAILFLIGKFLIGWYINEFGSTSAFGTAGSIVGLLLWVYYSAQVFFIGASFTFVYSQRYGFLSKKTS
jgi:membrane protein